MSDPTKTAPALPDARTELRGALGDFEYALVTAKHRIPDARRALTAAFAALDVAINEAVTAAASAGEARGRAAALAEVDDACVALAESGWPLLVRARVLRLKNGQPDGAPWEAISNPMDDGVRGDSPTAAILAAAAALAGGDE